MIVRQLDLHEPGQVLERWLAHHLAEVMNEADEAVGSATADAEARAVDLVLKLWIHRRALPASIGPLDGYEKAIKVLGLLMPDANPWRQFRRSDTYDDLSAVVAAGIQRLRDEEAERKAVLEAVAEEIRRRAEAPDEEFVEHTPGDFARILERMPAARRGDGPV